MNDEKMRLFVEFLKSEVEKGVSLKDIALFLKSEDADEETIKLLLAVISNGAIKECKECNDIFTGVLAYCPNCGGKLEKVF